MTNCNIFFLDPDQLHVHGIINFDNATQVMDLGCQLMHNLPVVKLNLNNLKHADSSALAVISAWIRYAKQTNKKIQIYEMPKFLEDLGKVSNLEKVFPLIVNS